ncbi:MAG: clostripain-related cysteine peptidase, partial [Candidatus Xenobia bacterium]
MCVASVPAGPVRKPWTILIYSAGDNNLGKCLTQNLDDCETVGSTDAVNIVSQLDVGGKTGANRLYITKDNQPGLHSPVVQKLGPVDMASPDTLADFVAWGMKNYPADHTMLILSDHGYGWRGAIQDDGAGKHLLGIPVLPRRMSLQGVQQALQKARAVTGKKLDILGWDACLMASAEVASQLQGQADYMVASEETEGDLGWPYTRIISPAMLATADAAIRTRAVTSPRDMARLVVNRAVADRDSLPTLAAYDMKQVPALMHSIKTFATALQNTDTKAGLLRSLARHSQAFHVYKVLTYRDLADFAGRVEHSPQIQDTALQQAAGGVKQALSNTLVAEQHAPDYPGAHGMTVQLGTVFFSPGHKYRALDMPKQTGWDQ